MVTIDLTTQYQRQYAWRDWNTAYQALPSLEGRTVLDLGCGVGDQAQDLSRLGARVTGVDMNAQLLAVAASRGIAGASFKTGNLREIQVTDRSMEFGQASRRRISRISGKFWPTGTAGSSPEAGSP